MFFFPIKFLITLILILALPILFVLGYLGIIKIGFQNLGFSLAETLLILFLMLVASAINIPLGRKKVLEIEESSFFGLIKRRKLTAQGLAINLGGAVVPVLISLYFLFQIPFKPAIVSILLMTIVAKIFSRCVANKGITIPLIVPPFFAVLFAFVFSAEFLAPTAFVAGVLGTLIGADILNLRKAKKINFGLISIGGAGVFDGIFLIGIISALISGFSN